MKGFLKEEHCTVYFGMGVCYDRAFLLSFRATIGERSNILRNHQAACIKARVNFFCFGC